MKIFAVMVVSLFRSLAIAALLCLAACSDTPERIENNDPSKYALVRDVLWASPGGFDLTMDIYTPQSYTAPLPVIVMFHGGGWLINDKSIMNQSAAYLATNGRYVVCNVNYRLLVDNDNTVTMNQIVEDVFGAVLWVKDNVTDYGGDPDRVVVTGDSAGGHLAAMIVNRGTQLSSTAMLDADLAFNPSYLPDGKSAEDVAGEDGLQVQAAVLSYGAFDIYRTSQEGFESLGNPFWWMGGAMARGVFGDEYNVDDNPHRYQAVSPVYHIPQATQRELPPQLLTVGSEDSVVSPESVRTYRDKLQAAGHPVDYWEYTDRPHAFLDSGSNRLLGIGFEQDAPPALDIMLEFLDRIFFSD